MIIENLLKNRFFFLIVSARPRARRDLAERAEYSTDETSTTGRVLIKCEGPRERGHLSCIKFLIFVHRNSLAPGPVNVSIRARRRASRRLYEKSRDRNAVKCLCRVQAEGKWCGDMVSALLEVSGFLAIAVPLFYLPGPQVFGRENVPPAGPFRRLTVRRVQRLGVRDRRQHRHALPALLVLQPSHLPRLAPEPALVLRLWRLGLSRLRLSRQLWLSRLLRQSRLLLR